jgi:hypothetical protein
MDEKDPQLVHLLIHSNEDLSEQPPEWRRLGCLLLIMGKYQKARQLAYRYFNASIDWESTGGSLIAASIHQR